MKNHKPNTCHHCGHDKRVPDRITDEKNRFICEKCQACACDICFNIGGEKDEKIKNLLREEK